MLAEKDVIYLKLQFLKILEYKRDTKPPEKYALQIEREFSQKALNESNEERVMGILAALECILQEPEMSIDEMLFNKLH